MITSENKQVLFQTTYKEAVNWLHNNYVLCNNIPGIDESVYGNAQFEFFNEDGEPTNEIFQWYVTDASVSDMEYLKEHFGLLFTFSDLLDCFILCVDHYGTSWDYVPCNVYGENKENSPHCKTYQELTGLNN